MYCTAGTLLVLFMIQRYFYSKILISEQVETQSRFLNTANISTLSMTGIKVKEQIIPTKQAQTVSPNFCTSDLSVEMWAIRIWKFPE